jgi:hypothetical protein
MSWFSNKTVLITGGARIPGAGNASPHLSDLW